MFSMLVTVMPRFPLLPWWYMWTLLFLNPLNLHVVCWMPLHCVAIWAVVFRANNWWWSFKCKSFTQLPRDDICTSFGHTGTHCSLPDKSIEKLNIMYKIIWRMNAIDKVKGRQNPCSGVTLTPFMSERVTVQYGGPSQALEQGCQVSGSLQKGAWLPTLE